MPVPMDPSFGWPEAITALTAVALIAFLVSWSFTDLGHVRRGPYIGVLGITVAAASVGYLAWSDTPGRSLVQDRWVLAVAVGAIVGLVMLPAARRLAGGNRASGLALARQAVWEGVVYGAAEGILLASLPTLIAWHAADAAGWTSTAWGRIAAGAVAIGAALAVILVHHLGYREFRSPGARTKLVGALAACGLQAAAFLLTSNVLAPVVAHVVLHGVMIRRGVEMPPISETERARPTASPHNAKAGPRSGPPVSAEAA
ncbi:MAG TPA: hypothetical protein VLA82_03435 [Actinomycetota bacterium]|nr:hypothetical protein [Actinomycetota bacterium]